MKQRISHDAISLWMVMLLIMSFVPLHSRAQKGLDQEVSITANGMPMEAVLKSFQKQTQLSIVYSSSLVATWPKVTMSLRQRPAREVLDKLMELSHCKYTYEPGIITIVHKSANAKHNTRMIYGHVFDISGEPLIGATVCLGESNVCAITNSDGEYSFSTPYKDVTLKFTYIGMEPQYVNIAAGTKTVIRDVTLKGATEIKEVVVNGLFERRKEGFTGAETTFDQKDLTNVGNENLLKSLAVLDPSFQIVDNINMGSDPNHMPDIQMRGQTSLASVQSNYSGNPNLPLFILDGFETSLEKVYDLDMNRVKSITLLKDAAAKAIYGSKAANGVVVIETKQAKEGKLLVSYTGNLSLEVPDLTGYNLMDAKQKLAFEKERGFYSANATTYPLAQEDDNFDRRYQENYANIVRGVDTYWLSKPLHTGLGHKHTLTLEGSDKAIRYIAGMYYNDINGTMKGSLRRTFNVNTTLQYTYNNLIFRNSLDYTKNRAKNSPYGTFSDYVTLNPYWEPNDENGNPRKILGYVGYSNTPVYNPLYNATLNVKDESTYNEVQDNFNVDWKISEPLRFVGKFSYVYRSSESDYFLPGDHTAFADYDENGLSNRKGRYTKGSGSMNHFIVNAGLNYNKEFGPHLIFANITWNLSNESQKEYTYTAEGFGNDYMDDITFANQYEEDSKPNGYNNKTREIGLIGAMSYSYDERYLLDLSARRTGSSIYGSKNRWGNFWSTGVGWNVHREPFAKNWKWLRRLKLRGSVGYTGTQNFNPYQSMARYVYGTFLYNGRYGAELEGLPNDRLRWQKSKDTNLGMDLMVKSWLNMRFDYYRATTNDLLSNISTPPSMGFSSYMENLGKIRNNGIEASIAVTPWRDDARRGWVTLTVTGLHNKNKIVKIYDIFKTFNEKQNERLDDFAEGSGERFSTPSTLYYEGQSTTAIWGVRSLGIDPMTGREMYLTKDGQKTYTWNAADQTVIGDSQPKLRGALAINAGYKGFMLTLAGQYKLGGDIYNSTLVNRVENVDGYYNLDRRILDSWRKVGDVAPYKALVARGSDRAYTKPTSRFIQTENELYISTINIGYEFLGQEWLRKAGLSRLKFSFYMNELARFSSIKIERGLTYPFARNFSFTVQAEF